MTTFQPDGAPVLTIAVPAYNVEAYLRRGLETYCDERLAGALEVIVVDDGSTDGTAAIAEEYAARAPRVIRVLSKENGGHGSAVNAGLAAARGRYFRVVDGDDWVDPAALAAEMEQLRVLDADLVVDVKREVDMATGAETVFPLADGVPAGRVLPFAAVCGNAEAAAQIKIHTLVARTDYLRAQRLHLLEHTFYEDYEYIVKASVPAQTIAFLDFEVYRYLVGNAGQSVSHANYVRRWADHTRVVDEMLRYLDEVEAEPGGVSPEALAYLRHKVHLIIDTHYNIALLFDADRARGRGRARAFRTELRRRNPDQWRAGEKRYKVALALNRLGLSYDSIERLVAGRRH